MIEYKALIAGILALVMLPSAFAHLAAGEDVAQNGYLIDFGYAPFPVHQADTIDLALNLVNETTNSTINPTSVWLRVSNDDLIVFAGELRPKNGHIIISLALPNPGEYYILARFKEEQAILAEHTFKITAQKSQASSSRDTIIFGLAMLIIFSISARLFIRYTKKNSKP